MKIKTIPITVAITGTIKIPGLYYKHGYWKQVSRVCYILNNMLDKNTKLTSKSSTQLGENNAQNYNTFKVAYYRDRGYSNIVNLISKTSK